MATILGGRSRGKSFTMLKTLEEYLEKLEKPKEKLVCINGNRVSQKILNTIDFKNVDYLVSTLLPDDIAFCVINKNQFDNFNDFLYKE